MSSVATLPQVPVIQEIIAVVRPAPVRRSLLRRRLVLLLAAALLSPGLLALPPVWHGALRTFLTWQASRNGYELTVAEITGGIFGMTRFAGVHLWQHGPNLGATDRGTDLTIESARFDVAWRFPWVKRSAPSMREIRLEGVGGRLDLTAGSSSGGILSRRVAHAVSRWLPTSFVFQTGDFEVVQGHDTLHLSKFRLSGGGDAAGEIAAREVRVTGPGFTRVLAVGRGQTFWKGNRLTILGLGLGDGISLASATLDLSKLGRQRLDWDCNLRAFGGEIRGQGAVDFAREGIAMEIAAKLHHISLASLAEMAGIREPVDGQVEEASFTFRGNPEDFSSAQMWLSARATAFQWGERHWDSLDTQTVVVNRRVQLHCFDLRQHGNRLSLSGEFPLPPDDAATLVWTGAGSWWQAAGFSCRIDARLEDLHALAGLVGPGTPDLAGRMSVNGELRAAPRRAEIEGYLNIEGSRLTICGAPLDFLRSTLLLRGGAVEVADVQATHDGDYLTAHGVIGLSGNHADRRGDLRAEIRDMSVYAPALAGLPGIGERAMSVRNLNAILRLENGELFFDQWDGEQAAFLLAR